MDDRTASYLLFWLIYFSCVILWPAIEAGQRRRWGWVVAIVLLNPLGALLWWIFARRNSPD